MTNGSFRSVLSDHMCSLPNRESPNLCFAALKFFGVVDTGASILRANSAKMSFLVAQAWSPEPFPNPESGSSSEVSFELQPTPSRKHSVHLMHPSNYGRQNFKTQLSHKASFDLQTAITSKAQLLPQASFDLQLHTLRNLRFDKRQNKASFELQLRLPSNYRPPKRQKHSFHLGPPPNYSSKFQET